MGRVKDALNEIYAEAHALWDVLGDAEELADDELQLELIQRCRGKADMIMHLALGATQEPEVKG